MAEDITTGTCCAYCCQYFQHPTKKSVLYAHGFPVVCWDCWRDLSKKEKKGVTRAEVKTL
jgi:hypothetical protein